MDSSRTRPPRRPPALPAAVGLVIASLLAACGPSRPSDPQAVLREAKTRLDSASAVHFRLTSSDAPARGQYIAEGEGDARRPASFRGSLQISREGLRIPVNILSVNRTFYVQLPFSGYERADPARYSFGDPAVLLDPDRGLSSLLSAARSATLGDRVRLEGEELDEVRASLPGDLVGTLLTSADRSVPKRDFSAVLGLDSDTHELRRVVLTGRFFDPERQSTYTLVLDRYGESIDITPPP